MPLYKVIRKVDDAEVTRYAAAQVALVDQYPLADYDHEEVPDAPPENPPYEGPWTITRLAFINRFTDAEWIAFDLAALDDPTGAPAARLDLHARGGAHHRPAGRAYARPGRVGGDCGRYGTRLQ